MILQLLQSPILRFFQSYPLDETLLGEKKIDWSFFLFEREREYIANISKRQFEVLDLGFVFRIEEHGNENDVILHMLFFNKNGWLRFVVYMHV